MKPALNAFLVLLLTFAVFGANGWGRASLSTWNSFVSDTDFYIPSFSTDVVSRFTPTQAIVVTRVEVQAVNGSQRISFGSPPVRPCAKPISFKITDGERSFTLPLPSAEPFVGDGPNPSSADSGLLDLGFPADAKVVLTVVPGDPADSTNHVTRCFANFVNVTVQYEANSPESKQEQKAKEKEN